MWAEASSITTFFTSSTQSGSSVILLRCLFASHNQIQPQTTIFWLMDISTEVFRWV